LGSFQHVLATLKLHLCHLVSLVHLQKPIHRGVGKQESTTRTVSFIGDFKTNKEERREFLSAVPESY
jgi:GTP cyclohydrolase I